MLPVVRKMSLRCHIELYWFMVQAQGSANQRSRKSLLVVLPRRESQHVVSFANSCQAFIVDLEHRLPEVAVVDSLLPCWDWISTAGC